MESITSFFRQLECPTFFDVSIKYFIAPIKLSNTSNQIANPNKSNPAELLLEDIEKEISNLTSKYPEFTFHYQFSTKVDFLRNYLSSNMTKPNQFYTVFPDLFQSNEYPIFKLAILAQTAMNIKLKLESNNNTTRQASNNDTNKRAITNYSYHDKIITIYVFRGLISLFIYLKTNSVIFFKDEELPLLPKVNFAALPYLFQYLNAFFEHDSDSENSPNDSSPDSFTNDIMNLSLSNHIDTNDIAIVINFFMDFFNDNLKQVINFKGKNNTYFAFLTNSISIFIDVIEKFAQKKNWKLILSIIQFFVFYFTNKQIDDDQSAIIFPLYLNLCDQLAKALNYDCPDTVQSNIVFFISTILGTFGNLTNHISFDLNLKLSFQTLLLFAKITIFKNDEQSGLVFMTSLISFINNISKGATDTTDTNYAPSDLTNYTSINDIRCWNPSEYFPQHQLMRNFTVQDIDDSNIQKVAQFLKKFVENLDFSTGFIFDLLTINIHTIEPSSLILLLPILSGKVVTFHSSVGKFVEKLFEKDIFQQTDTFDITWTKLQFQTYESIICFTFNVIAFDKASQVMNIFSKFHFSILKYLLPMFRSLLMIDKEIQFSKRFCQSKVIDMIRLSMTKSNMEIEKIHFLMNEIAVFLQVMAFSSARVVFATYSFAPLLKEFLQFPEYTDLFLPSIKIGLLTSDEKCIFNIMQQLAAIIVQAMEEPEYASLANKSIKILADTTSSISKNGLKEYENTSLFECISKLPIITKNRDALINTLQLLLNTCIKFHHYIHIFEERLIYQNLREAFYSIEPDSDIFILLISMAMNKIVDPNKIEDVSIQNRVALKLLFTVIKDSNEELTFLNFFADICSSNYANIYECYQSDLISYLLDRVDVIHLQYTVFALLKKILTMFCSPIVLNKIHSCIISAKCKNLFMNTILDMMKDDSKFPISSFFAFSGQKSGIAGPSIDASDLSGQWSFSTIIMIEKAPAILFKLNDGGSFLTFGIDSDFHIYFTRSDKGEVINSTFQTAIPPKNWKFLTITVTQKTINVYINFSNKETYNLPKKCAFDSTVMIKIAEEFTGELGPTYFLSTADIHQITEETHRNKEMIKKSAICSYDPRATYLGQIIDPATAKSCILIGTAVPFCTTFKQIIQNDSIYQLFLSYFLFIDSEEFFILCLKVLAELVNISERNTKNFEKIGGFRLLMGLFSSIKKEFFTVNVSKQLLTFFKSLKSESLQRQMIESYWLNLSFIKSLHYDFQSQFANYDISDIFDSYSDISKLINFKLVETNIYHFAYQYESDQSNSGFGNKLDLIIFDLFANTQVLNSLTILRRLFLVLIFLYSKHLGNDLQKRILLVLLSRHQQLLVNKPILVDNQAPAPPLISSNYILPFLQSNDLSIRKLALKLIFTLISVQIHQSYPNRDILHRSILFIKDDESELFPICYELMFTSSERVSPKVEPQPIKSARSKSQLLKITPDNSSDQFASLKEPVCEFYELTPILFMLSIFHTKKDSEQRHPIYQQIIQVLPQLQKFYNDPLSSLSLFLFSLNFSDDVDHFVQPFVIATLSNIDLLENILVVMNSFMIFTQLNILDWKIAFFTQLLRKALSTKKNLLKIVTVAVKFMCFRIHLAPYSNEQSENETGPNQMNSIQEFRGNAKDVEFSYRDSLAFIDYLARTTTLESLDQSYIYNPALIKNMAFLESLYECIALLIQDQNSDFTIPFTTRMNYSALKMKKIIASLILRDNPNHHISETVHDDFINHKLNHRSNSPSSSDKKHTSTEMIHQVIREGELFETELMNFLFDESWQLLVDTKPIFISYRTGLLFPILNDYCAYATNESAIQAAASVPMNSLTLDPGAESLVSPSVLMNIQSNEVDANHENEEERIEFIEYYYKTVIKTYKKFMKFLKTRTFMYQQYNLKMATAYMNELNEQLIDSSQKHWKLSNKSDLTGRKLYFTLNRNFDDHKYASFSRDEIEQRQYNQTDGNEKKNKEQIVSFKRILDMNHSLKKNNKFVQDLSFEVMMTTVVGQYQGTLTMINNYISFEGTLKYQTFESSNSRSNSIISKQKFARVHLNQIAFIFNRWTMHVDNSCEVFTTFKKSYYFIFPDNATRRDFYSKISNIIGKTYKTTSCPYFFKDCRQICGGICQNQISNSELVQKSSLVQDWQNHRISNYVYIFLLNIVSGRSFNDLSQYPVFPWILRDYTSPTIDLKDETIYRDLSLPIAALNQDRIRECLSLYDDIYDVLEKCLYRSHYSNAAFVINYLIRVEPFTSLHIDLQSGHFDYPERLFYSIQTIWEGVVSSLNDYKELIPEFFTLPQMFTNENRFDLGILYSNHKEIDNVDLPPWASTPFEFIEIHRRALESRYTQLHINEWIDLIFGCYQKSLDKLNLFHTFTYHECMTLPEVMNDPSLQQMAQHHSANFGCCPDMIFTSPSPKMPVSLPMQISTNNYRLPKSQSTKLTGIVYPDISTVINLDQLNASIVSNPTLSHSLNEEIMYVGDMIVLLQNGVVLNILKNFTTGNKLSISLEPQYRDIVYFPESQVFVFLQKNGGFATCAFLQSQQSQQSQQKSSQPLIKTICHRASTIECMCKIGENFLATGGSDCCFNLWSVSDFSLQMSIPIQSSLIVDINGDAVIERLVAIDDQNLVYSASTNPPRHISTFPLNLDEKIIRNHLLVLRNAQIAIASDSSDGKTFILSFFDIRGILLDRKRYDGKIVKFFPLYPSPGETFIVMFVYPKKNIMIIDLATHDIVSSEFTGYVAHDFICPFANRRSILYLQSAQTKVVNVYEF